MPMSAATLLGSYRYDALNRLANCRPAGKDAVRRFYLKDRTCSELQGTSGRSIAQAEHWLLAVIATDAAGNQNALLATDQSHSVLHSLNDQQRHTCAYPPYGTSAKTAQPVLTGYTGQIPDPVTGHFLLGNGYRAFNPVLMRFNSPDTVSPFDEGGLNAYAYCKGDPINSIDQDGHMSFRLAALFVKAVGRFRAPTRSVVRKAVASTTLKTPISALANIQVNTLQQSSMMAFSGKELSTLKVTKPYSNAVTQINANFGDSNLAKFLSSAKGSWIERTDQALLGGAQGFLPSTAVPVRQHVDRFERTLGIIKHIQPRREARAIREEVREASLRYTDEQMRFLRNI